MFSKSVAMPNNIPIFRSRKCAKTLGAQNLLPAVRELCDYGKCNGEDSLLQGQASYYNDMKKALFHCNNCVSKIAANMYVYKVVALHLTLPHLTQT